MMLANPDPDQLANNKRYPIRELEENNIRISCRIFVRLQGVMTGA